MPYGTTTGQIPVIVSTTAYIQEAYNGSITRNEDLKYSETSSAQSTITSKKNIQGFHVTINCPVIVDGCTSQRKKYVPGFTGAGNL